MPRVRLLFHSRFGLDANFWTRRLAARIPSKQRETAMPRELVPADFLPDASRCYHGPGHICALLQITLQQMRTVMESTGVRFVLSIDGIPFVDANGLEKLQAECNRLRAEIAAAEKSMQQRN
jgi:hypothetical protein